MQAFLFCVCVCVCETMEYGDKNHENTLIKDQDLQKPYPMERHIPTQPINGSTPPGSTCNIYKIDVVILVSSDSLDLKICTTSTSQSVTSIISLHDTISIYFFFMFNTRSECVILVEPLCVKQFSPTEPGVKKHHYRKKIPTYTSTRRPNTWCNIFHKFFHCYNIVVSFKWFYKKPFIKWYPLLENKSNHRVKQASPQLTNLCH